MGMILLKVKSNISYKQIKEGDHLKILKGIRKKNKKSPEGLLSIYSISLHPTLQKSSNIAINSSADV